MITTMRNLKTVFTFLGLLLIAMTVNVMAQNPSALETLKINTPADTSIELPTPPQPKIHHPYLKSVDELYGEQLFQYLHDITAFSIKEIDEKSAYTSAKSHMYSTTDNITCNGRPGIITFYSL